MIIHILFAAGTFVVEGFALGLLHSFILHI
jgi:hypothetical protein